MKILSWLIGLFLLTLAPLHPNADAQEGEKTIVLFAAASTYSAIEAIKGAYEASHPNVKIRVSYGASALLARQISKGAPADLFLSANKHWVDWMGDNNISTTEPVIVAGNNLTFITQPDSKIKSCPKDKERLHAMLGKERLVIADPEVSPLGQYSKEALIQSGLWDDVKERLAIASNANLVVKMIERGATPLGIAYMSSTAGNDAVKELCMWTGYRHNPINYYLVSVKAPQITEEFINFIRHEGGRHFVNTGFIGITPK